MTGFVEQLERMGDEVYERMGWHRSPGGLTRQAAIAKLRAEDPQIDWASRAARAYCGWLTLQPDFQKEQRQLLAQLRELVESERQSTKMQTPNEETTEMGPRAELPADTMPSSSVSKGSTVATISNEERVYSSNPAQVLARWRLMNLRGPNLPLPIGPHLPLLTDSAHAAGASTNVGRFFFMPDTFPLPDGQTLRAIMENALRSAVRPTDGQGNDSVAHLRDWLDIIRGGNTGKNQIDRYGRLFRLRHYWHVLHYRYSEACHRRQAGLERVFAAWLGVKRATVHRDLGFIVDQLGKSWWRQSPALVGPSV